MTFSMHYLLWTPAGRFIPQLTACLGMAVIASASASATEAGMGDST